MTKTAIIGLGVVGTAIYKTFKDFNIDTVCYDKYKEDINDFSVVLGVDIIFLSLPTPYDDDMKEYNKTAIYENCEQLQKNNFKGLVVLKSTVEPTTTLELVNKYKLNMVHNPEFLTARTAYYDFKNQEHIVIGHPMDIPDKKDDALYNFYKEHFANSEYSICKSNESEMMKIGVNCFYSVKVQFFNELFFLSKKIDTDYDEVVKLMLKNGWISNNHVSVPGPDDKFAYGGVCFPKDTNALNQFMIKKESINKVLNSTIEERNLIRDIDVEL